MLPLPRRIFTKISYYVFRNKGLFLVSYNNPEKREVISLISRVKRERGGFSDLEAYQLFTAVRAASKIERDIAEVGVYNGCSSRIICEIKRNKSLHLFDTFEGLPDADDDLLYKGKYKTSLNAVQDYLKEYPNVCFYKGLFPETADPVKNKTFSFVHLDADLYKSTLDGLKFFYPRMNGGGIILSHDYSTLDGVKKAFHEFFEDRAEPIIELPGSQCLIVKI